ncbi:MAG: hypothetical protein Q4D81_11370 [Eubacteriales bacterium]|nr:hypothetical protein [Eubacteriales bacterium]
MIRRLSELSERISHPGKKAEKTTAQQKRGSDEWIPFASWCTTGQFMNLDKGFKNHCGPTAAVNVIRMLKSRLRPGKEPSADEELFLTCAGIGRKMGIYWNREILGRFGGTSNFLTGPYLRRCLKKTGLEDAAIVRFHPWITPDAVRQALDTGAIVYLEVYYHPKYKNHHMLCCGYRRQGPKGPEQFLLSDGWTRGPVWVSGDQLGHGHFLTIRLK